MLEIAETAEKNRENTMVYQNALKGMILCGLGHSWLYKLEKKCQYDVVYPLLKWAVKHTSGDSRC